MIQGIECYEEVCVEAKSLINFKDNKPIWLKN